MRSDAWHTFGWAVLGGLVLVTGIAAVSLAPATATGQRDTCAMQAASLAWDFDLAYERQDFDRFAEHWGREPESLTLERRRMGSRATFGTSWLWALGVAPLIRLAPLRGAALANAFLLALGALVAAAALRRRLGEVAPWWVAVWLFASVSFAWVFQGGAEILPLVATVGAFALAYGGEPPSGIQLGEIYQQTDLLAPASRVLLRWLGVGVLLGVVTAHFSAALVLLVPLSLAVPARRRRSGVAALLLGAGALLALYLAVHWAAGGSLAGLAGERFRFSRESGFPGVDFPRQEWSAGEAAGVALDLRPEAPLWGWNLLYLLAGRNVGILPHFLPLVLGFFAFDTARGRGFILPAVLVAAMTPLVLAPFNFWGGPGGLANRHFLVLYPALWFVAGRPSRKAWALLVAVVGGIYVWPLWLAPREAPLGAAARAAFVAQWLPYETTQREVPGSEALHGGLWLRFLNDNVWATEGGRELRVMGDRPAELLVASQQPLAQLLLDFERRAPANLEVAGGEPGETRFHPDGSLGFAVLLEDPRARHSMWWTRRPLYLYELRLRLPEAPPVPLELRITAQEGQEEGS